MNILSLTKNRLIKRPVNKGVIIILAIFSFTVPVAASLNGYFGAMTYREGAGDMNVLTPVERVNDIEKPNDAVEIVTPKSDSEHLSEISRSSERSGVVLHDVPFTSQAPSKQWDNIVFQNGCEEASMIMAVAWINGSGIEKRQNEREIERLNRYAQDIYGEGTYDTSIADTMRVLEENYTSISASVRVEISVSDMINEISDGNILIVPANGRLLRNPHFRPPGPEHHMLVVTGYDFSKGEFITNDPGTEYGSGYRYNSLILHEALHDYPTGYHGSYDKEEKNIIVLKKKSL